MLFGLHGVSLLLFLAASSAPTPLYGLYEDQWGYSSFVSSVIFSAYAIAILLSLMFFGSLSDHYGRRPVILCAFGMEICALLIFMGANGSVPLIVARIVQGFATGLATSSLGAALVDLDRERGALANSIMPLMGLGLGALGSGLLADFAPFPLRFGFALICVGLLIQSIRTLRAPVHGVPLDRAGRMWRPHFTIPSAARSAFLAVSPINIGVWSLGAFCLSLMPSVMEQSFGRSGWMGALPAASLTFSAACAMFVTRRFAPHAALLLGTGTLACGALIMLISYVGEISLLLFPAFVVAGLGFGASFLGCMRTVIPLAP